MRIWPEPPALDNNSATLLPVASALRSMAKRPLATGVSRLFHITLSGLRRNGDLRAEYARVIAGCHGQAAGDLATTSRPSCHPATVFVGVIEDERQTLTSPKVPVWNVAALIASDASSFGNAGRDTGFALRAPDSGSMTGP